MELDELDTIDDVDIEFDELIGNLEISTSQFEEDQNDYIFQVTKANQVINKKIQRHKNHFLSKISQINQTLINNYRKGISYLNGYNESINKILQSLVICEIVFIFLFISSLWTLLVTTFPSIFNIIPLSAELGKFIFIGISSILLIIAALFIWITYNEDKNFDPQEIIDLEEQLGNIEQLQISPYQVDNEINAQTALLRNLTNSFFSTTKQIQDSIPIYKQIHKDDKFRKKWNLICDNKKNVLNFFGIYNVENEISALKNNPDYNLFDFDERIQEGLCRNHFSKGEVTLIDRKI